MILLCSGSCYSEESYGVKRAARLSEFPDPTCVRATIEQIPGILGFKEWHWPDEYKGKAQDEWYAHHFSYDGDHAKGIQLGLFDEVQKIRLVQSYMRIDKRPPQSEVDEARHLMILVEEGMETRCGVVDLREKLREHCSGVECR